MADIQIRLISKGNGADFAAGPRVKFSRPVLIVGIGNELRRDDSAGIMAARRLAAFGLPGVRVWWGQGLVPELACEFAGASTVIMIDAVTVNFAVTGDSPPSAIGMHRLSI